MPAPSFDSSNSDTPAEYAVEVAPSDSTDLTRTCRALYIGVAGSVVVNMPDGGTVTFAGLQAGTVLPVRVRRVRATGTTATSIVALF